MRIKETVRYYDLMQPILFPYGSYKWDTNTRSQNDRRITCREITTTCYKLRWISQNQNNIHAEMYQGLQDALHVGEYNAGKKTG
ncbi:hypothetical protein Lal_00037624 [Lupinus albus]|nr:hypothetical protein Lal_00037624 [Lupinus albus]